MKKKLKLCSLLVLLFICTGCSGSYEVEIYNNKVTETITTLYRIDELNGMAPSDKTIEIANKYSDNADFLTFSTTKQISENNLSGNKMMNTYNTINSYKESSFLLGSCYAATSFTNNNDYITLKTSRIFNCYDSIEEFDSIDIIVKSNHKLKETNADEKKGHTYIWHLTRDNYQDKAISLQLYSDKYVWNYNNEAIKRTCLVILVIGGTILLGFGGNKLYKRMEKNKNKI